MPATVLCFQDLAGYLVRRSYLLRTIIRSAFVQLVRAVGVGSNVRSGISLVFRVTPLAWRYWEQPLWAKARQASSARREIMRSDNVGVGMAGRDIEEPLSRLKSRG